MSVRVDIGHRFFTTVCARSIMRSACQRCVAVRARRVGKRCQSRQRWMCWWLVLRGPSGGRGCFAGSLGYRPSQGRRHEHPKVPRIVEALTRVGRSRASIWRMVKEGQCPTPRRSPNRERNLGRQTPPRPEIANGRRSRAPGRGTMCFARNRSGHNTASRLTPP
jgi:hypothetical protein